jgi:hypothetical protein
MNRDGLMKFYFGFLFIMIDFKFQGIDVLPDIIGYILFAVGLSALALNSEYFNKAKPLNYVLIILSILSIYEKPTQGSGIQLGTFGIFGILLGVIGTILNLLVVYYIFMGIKDMAVEHNDLRQEADQRWKQYLYLQIAALASFALIFIPPLALIFIVALFIVSIILTVVIMGFIKRCSECL